MSSRGRDTRRRILEAANRLLTRSGGTEVSMGAIAEAAGVSRQAIYLHFDDRAALLIATVDHIDESYDLGSRTRPVLEAPSGAESIDRFVELNAAYMPLIADVARAIDGARRNDPDLEAAWQDRMRGRRERCRWIVRRLAEEETLAPGWTIATAADLLWEMTSPRTWDDLVVDRGWSSRRYTDLVTQVLRAALVRPRKVRRRGR